MKKIIYSILFYSSAFSQFYENFEDLSDWDISGGGNWSISSSNYCDEGQCANIYFPNDQSGEDAVISRSISVNEGAILSMYLYGYWGFDVQIILDGTVIYDNAISGYGSVEHTINTSGYVNLSIIAEFATLGSGYFDELFITEVYDGPTWHISTSGSDDNDGSEESPFATIQAGINASSDGDSILVDAGTYVENINYNGKNIVVQGEDRETTIIDGNQGGTVVLIGGGTLDEFTITNGSEGGVKIENDEEPVISNAIISGNTSSGSGGGILATSYSDVTIKYTLIYNNNSSWGGGVYADNDANVYIKNSTIAYNNASVGSGLMVYAYADIYVENSIVYFNNSNNTWSNASISTSYSNVEGWGGGGIDTDPLFVDHINGDFSLQPESPCIDAGNPDQDNDGEDYTTDIDDF